VVAHEDERGRPDRTATHDDLYDNNANPETPAERRADLELRIATLRVYASHFDAIDNWLAADLRDFADLLDCLEREGRWE
jgi:hypothetical protein